MSRALSNGRAAGRLASQVDGYFSKYGRGSRAAWLVWFLSICALVCYYLYVHLQLPIKVRGNNTTYRSGEDTLLWNWLIIPLTFITVTWVVLEIVLKRRAKRRHRERMDALMSKNGGVAPEEFLGKGLYLDKDDFTGIYILHNLASGEYYMGQGIHVLKRVRQYFTAHGNGDVYAGWKCGNPFTIQTTRLSRGFYKIVDYIPAENDPYAEAVTLAGEVTYLFGESVLAMLKLAPTNSTRTFVTTPKRMRKSPPASMRVFATPKGIESADYEEIPAELVADAICFCRGDVMDERLADAMEEARRQGYITEEARRQGYITEEEAEALLQEIGAQG